MMANATHSLRTTLSWTLVAAMLLALIATLGELRFRSAAAGFQYLGGRRVIVVHYPIRVESQRGERDKATFPLRVYNCASQPLRLLGAGSACTCTTAEGL